MDLRFVGQPYPNKGSMLEVLTGALDNPQLSSVQVAVAWAKRSGLRHLVDALRSHRAAGGRVEVLVGISEGGATKQGLEILLQEADEAWIFYDAARTFHPKVFVASGESESIIAVGSHNLTKGGLFWNYEASFVAHLNLSQPGDRLVHDEVTSYMATLRSDSPVCIKLDENFLQAMVNDPRYRIGDEDHPRRPRSGITAGHEGDDTDDFPGASELPDPESLLFRSSETKKQAGPLQPSAGRSAQEKEKVAVGGAREVEYADDLIDEEPPVDSSAVGAGGGVSASGTGYRPAAGAVTRRWFKQMDRSAAQQPANPSTNPTGNLRLSAEGFAIDHTTYFRDHMFGRATWIPRAQRPSFEDATVMVRVEIDGSLFGIESLKISHSPERVSNQGNVASVLHWGSRLSPFLRAHNMVGRWLTLESLSDGSYVLTLDRAPRGSFIH